MILARPEYLWLLAAVALAGASLTIGARRRRRAGAAATGGPWETLAHGACFLGGLTCLVLSAAGPGLGRGEPAPAAGPGRLLVALDCSRSMLARDVPPDRLGAAKAVARAVLARLPDLPAGLVVFAGRARLACPVTRDRAGLLLFLDAAGPADAPLGGTSLAGALEACRLALADGEPAAVLLLSDGEDTLTTPDPGRESAALPVFTVAVGGALPVGLPDAGGGLARDGAGRPVTVGLDTAGLAELAARHQGEAFRLSPDGPDPAPAIAAALAERVPTGPGQAGLPRPKDRSAVCLGLGLALLLSDLLAFPRARLPGLGCLLAVLLAAGPAEAATSAATVLDQGLDAYAAGRYAAARELFLSARARDPDAPEILFALGAADYRLGRLDAALAYFDRAAQAATGALRARARYNQGNAAFRLGDFRHAVACYQAALALAPDDAEAKANLALARARLTGEPPAAPDAPQEAGQPSPAPGAGVDSRSGQTTGPATGQASQGRDPADGRATVDPAAPTGPPAGDRPGPEAASQAVTADQGRPGGLRRAAPDDRPGQPLFDRVPDLPGLPLAQPAGGLPRVERDW